MIDFSMIGKVLNGAVKIGQYLKENKEEEQMQAIADNLRRRIHSNKGNALKPEIGSKEDRLYSKMVAKGYLVRAPLGYMLPETIRRSSPS